MIQPYDRRVVLLSALEAAGALIRSRFDGTFAITHKEGINNLLTEVDKLAEQCAIDLIHAGFPQDGIISEERDAQNRESAYQWIIDPIDGTVNFAHAIPLCCVSIALQYQDELLLGGVYNPIMNELFFAGKGEGAFLNGKKISVSRKQNFLHACLVTGFPYTWPEAKVHPLKVFEHLVLKGLPIRRLGSAALDLCWVACGRFDGFWEYNLHAWDVAAGYLIVQEAGGTVSDFRGNRTDVFGKETLATNGLIHEVMLREIGSVNP